MVSYHRTDFPAKYLNSLCWHGDELVDIRGGGTRYSLEGDIREPRVARGFAYPFDSVVSLHDVAVLYEALGTKGLLVDLKKLDDIREINRSYYHARDYYFPISLFTLPDGRDVIASCPEEYDKIELELVSDGTRLIPRDESRPDIFHSRLQASRDGKYLLSRGWVWQPWNVVSVFDVEKGLDNPNHFDTDGFDLPNGGSLGWEADTATFCDHRLVLASILESGGGEDEEPEEEEEFEILLAESSVPENPTTEEGSGENEGRIHKIWRSDISVVDAEGNPLVPAPDPRRPRGLRYLLQVYDLDAETLVSSREMPELVGRMMPVGAHHVVSFFHHPKLIEVETGRVVAHWEDLDPGPERGQPSAMMQAPGEPYLTLDPAHHRFALGTKDAISVIQFHGVT